jgi:hypothetical protein
MTFEQIRAFIYELKMDVAYNRKDFNQLKVIHDRCDPMLFKLNDELASGYWAHTPNYELLRGYKCDLHQIQKNCEELRMRIYYGNDSEVV